MSFDAEQMLASGDLNRPQSVDYGNLTPLRDASRDRQCSRNFRGRPRRVGRFGVQIGLYCTIIL